MSILCSLASQSSVPGPGIQLHGSAHLTQEQRPERGCWVVCMDGQGFCSSEALPWHPGARRLVGQNHYLGDCPKRALVLGLCLAHSREPSGRASAYTLVLRGCGEVAVTPCQPSHGALLSAALCPLPSHTVSPSTVGYSGLQVWRCPCRPFR